MSGTEAVILGFIGLGLMTVAVIIYIIRSATKEMAKRESQKPVETAPEDPPVS